ncbi:abortive infection protein [Thermoanaerobacter kivui]|uniref:Abortive infection protein n=2 Tax=Thermoanaerobacter kivui TaxID=2325 RepID=A0A097AP20_THEKI|nr:abortive infection protein [Thermoanaerobacter kivui]
MNILKELLIYLVTFFILLTKVLKWDKNIALKLYISLLILAAWINVLYAYNSNIQFTGTLSITILLVVSITSLVYYVLDFMLINIIKSDVLILDIAYYFKGRVKMLEFLTSVIIGILEELVFRLYLIESSIKMEFLLLILSSMCFSMVHIFFSKYDVLSKMVMGLVLGYIFIQTHNILYPITFHMIYNWFALKKKG